MVKLLSLALFLLFGLCLAAQEITWEQYPGRVDFWIVVAYNNLNFPKGADHSDYQISLQINNSRKKQVFSWSKTLSVPRADWLTDNGIPLRVSAELTPGSYSLQMQMKNKAMGDKRQIKKQFEVTDTYTEIGMGWLLANKAGTEFIPARLNSTRFDSLTLWQGFSLELDSLAIRINDTMQMITKPVSPLQVEIADYRQGDSANQISLTFYEQNIQYRTGPFLFTPWYAYTLRYPLEDQMMQIRYIATQNEWQVLRKLPHAKYAEAIEGFWRSNDPSPGTVRNENRETFYQRVIQADELFTIHKKMKGWASDRGRIYIKYGAPDEITSDTYPLGMYPHIVWYYYKQNLEFVFADTKGYGQYTLRNKDEEY